MVTITLRKPKPEEFELLADFQVVMAKETEEKILDPETVQKGVKHMMDNPSLGFYLVADVDGEPAGMSGVTYEWSDWRNGLFWWIQDVYVIKKFRNKGVWRAIYQKIRDDAKATEGVAGVRLYHAPENHTARSVYLKVGMEDCDYKLMELDFAST
ncbi:hypothetical protein NDN08_000351 [Rhodosorus marinus]|uniref:N-acetyltransferase domain-containing protein n=1 Tax=Rhodosorus marinus TaxID=101924 RepID=A0AAV8URW5_9RHOD|nr:hypothetical protein NDN08_000351 [Rhodosorus marinus]